MKDWLIDIGRDKVLVSQILFVSRIAKGTYFFTRDESAEFFEFHILLKDEPRKINIQKTDHDTVTEIYDRVVSEVERYLAQGEDNQETSPQKRGIAYGIQPYPLYCSYEEFTAPGTIFEIPKGHYPVWAGEGECVDHIGRNVPTLEECIEYVESTIHPPELTASEIAVIGTLWAKYIDPE